MSKLSRAKKKAIVRAMIIASLIGLMVPFSVVSSVLIALLLFKSLSITLRALLMIAFGLAGLGISTVAYLKIIRKLQSIILPGDLGEKVKERS